AVQYYAHEVVLPALGWHISWQLRDIAGLAGATALMGGFIFVVLAAAVATQPGRCRVFVVTAVATGLVFTAVTSALVLGRAGAAGAGGQGRDGTRRPLCDLAHPAARCRADRGGRRLRAPVVAAPQGHRRGRRADSGPGSRLGHGLPLPGSPLRRARLGLGAHGGRVA